MRKGEEGEETAFHQFPDPVGELEQARHEEVDLLPFVAVQAPLDVVEAEPTFIPESSSKSTDHVSNQREVELPPHPGQKPVAPSSLARTKSSASYPRA
ncbi:MAG: hypothetical protein MjAS7_0110 [Metallosphaera javensis (ex Sakai et al. 2022)]|nr:MAG: hypothetical protein MjAS7_0110 [Metallosphaera javensis (ex Sakai et al. 2022)]